MKKILFPLFVLVLSFSNANAQDENYDDESMDPAESINRNIQSFNDVVDDFIYKPIARSYRYVVPAWGRQRVTNVVSNLGEPVTVANSVLQGDAQNAFTSFWRFVFNTTFGALGTFDAASDLGLKHRPEDFGQTLASWGWKESSYFVIPFLGPSTVRDTIGMGVDYFADPFTNQRLVGHEVKTAVIVARALDLRTRLLDTTDDIERNSLDKYASYRSLYLQKRKSDIYNGLPPIY
jgi:phospholipid-binding lipoprotein MlaA